MARPPEQGLTARESELMNVIWELGEITVEDLRERLEAELSGSTLRTLLAILEGKGYVRRSKRGRANVYIAVTAREAAQRNAVRTLTERLFRGSASGLLARLVEDEDITLEELDRLRRKLRDRKKEAR